MNHISESSDWSVQLPPDDADVRALRKGLYTFNVERSYFEQGQKMAIFLRDDAEDIVAGIYGWLWGECLEIILLWIDEPLRGQGLGRQLLARIEQAGKELGACTAMVVTFSFQAPAFYEKYGYQTFGLIEGYGDQHSKYFMRKNLA